MIVVLSPGVETRLSTEKQTGPPAGPVRCKNLRAVLRSEENHICVYASDLVPVEYLPPSARRVDCYVSIAHPVLESGISDSVKAPGKGPHLLLCVDPADPDGLAAPPDPHATAEPHTPPASAAPRGTPPEAETLQT